MPVVQMPDGANVQFPDDMPREQIRSLIVGKFPNAGGQPSQVSAPQQVPAPQQPDQTKIGGLMDFGNNIAQNFVGGVQAAGDLAFGDFETPKTHIPAIDNFISENTNIKQATVTPTIQNLADKLFPQGSDGSMGDFIKNLTKPDAKDYSAAFLEKFGANPAGKGLAALGGVLPIMNAAGSAYQTFARPALLKTGIAPDNLDAAMLVGGAALGAKQLAKGKPVFAEKAVQKTAQQMKQAGVTPEQAIQVMESAKKQGVNVTLPEASVRVGTSPTGAPYAIGNKLTNQQRAIEQSPTAAAETIGQAKAGRAGQIADILNKQGQGIVETSKAISEPLYNAVNPVKLDKATVKSLKLDPVIKDALGTFTRDKKLGYKVQGMGTDTVGYFNEVKKYIDAQKKLGATDNYLKGLYTDATRKITGALDEVTTPKVSAYPKSLDGVIELAKQSKTFAEFNDKIKGLDVATDGRDWLKSRYLNKEYIDATDRYKASGNVPNLLYKDVKANNLPVQSGGASLYAQAREASMPAIVAKNNILKPVQKSDSLGTIKNQIFSSPAKRAELQRGIGADNFKNLSDVIDIIERTQKTSSGGSDTYTKMATAADMESNFSKGAKVARGGFFGTAAAAFDYIGRKIEEGNYQDLATLYTTENLNALRKELGAAYAKTPDGKVQAVTNFLQNKLPQAVLKAAPSNIAIQEQGRDRTVQTPPVTLPNATQPSTMEVTPFEQLLPEAQPNVGTPPTLTSEPLLPSPQSSIEGVIGEAAQIGGANPDLLQAIAETESSLNPQAQATTSSAAGLFQITKPTWKQLVAKYGKDTGIAMKDILDPRANAIMASYLTKENSDKVSKALGRDITAGESYIAHFMGASGATKLLQADDGKLAWKLFPQAAKANKSIFFSGKTPRTVGELKSVLSNKVESKIAANEQRKQQEQPAPQPQKQMPQEPDIQLAKIPFGAIQELRNNPQSAQQFDAIFGAGTAKKLLNT